MSRVVVMIITGEKRSFASKVYETVYTVYIFNQYCNCDFNMELGLCTHLQLGTSASQIRHCLQSCKTNPPRMHRRLQLNIWKCDNFHNFSHMDSCNPHRSDYAHKQCPAVIPKQSCDAEVCAPARLHHTAANVNTFCEMLILFLRRQIYLTIIFIYHGGDDAINWTLW